MENLKIFVPLSKVDKEKKMVYGYASTEALDSQGEVITKEAMSKALPGYLKFGNIREMHQPSAVGKTKEAKMDDNGLYIGVKVVDKSAWEKVKEGVYNGFSIGGTKLLQKGNKILDLVLSEISLVDRPANPEAVFDVFKAEYKGEMSDEMKRGKISQALNSSVYEMGYGVMELFSDSVIVYRYNDSTYWIYDYAFDSDGNCKCDNPREVKMTWAEKNEKSKMTKILGYEPWYIKYFQSSLTKSMSKELKKEDAPVEEPKEEVTPTEPTVEEKPEEKVEEPKAEEKQEEKPAEPEAPKEEEKEPEEKQEEVAKIGAKLSKKSIATLQEAMSIINSLLETKEEKTAMTKTESSEFGKMLGDHLAKVTDMIDKKVNPLKEQVESLQKAYQPIKAKSGYVVQKSEPEGEEKNELEKLESEFKDLLAKRETMETNEFSLKHGQRAQEIVTKLRQMKMKYS